MAKDKHEQNPSEARSMELLHVAGINIAVFSLAAASLLAFLLSLTKLIGALILLLGIRIAAIEETFKILGIEEKPVVLMLVDIVDTSLLGAILLTFAFGLKSVFLGKRYSVMAFDIRDLNELKEYLIGLVITLMGTRFLERILRGGREANILGIGIGIAAVILSLAVYEFVLQKHKAPHEDLKAADTSSSES